MSLLLSLILLPLAIVGGVGAGDGDEDDLAAVAAAEVRELLWFASTTFDEFEYTHLQNDTWLVEEASIEATGYLLASIVDLGLPCEIKDGRLLIHPQGA